MKKRNKNNNNYVNNSLKEIKKLKNFFFKKDIRDTKERKKEANN